ncbi:hypothetical protein ACJJTC_010092 [Scirpophaga incertulas]
MSAMKTVTKLNKSVEFPRDTSKTVNTITRSELYNILKGFKGKKIDEKFTLLEDRLAQLTSCPKLPLWPSQKPGRPVKQFHELSERSKRRRTKELRAHVPVEELTFAACVSQSTSGNKVSSKMIKEITSTPTKAKKFRRIISSEKDHDKMKYTPQEALSLFVEETHFNVELQALLDHTALRLVQYLKEVLDTLANTEKQNLILISKWGCDGSHQTPFKQKFENVTDDDSNIFMSSIVPVRLIVSVDGQTTKTIWQNPVPSSVRFCRPIRARFLHETKDVTKEEIEHIRNQAKNLKGTEDSEKLIKISHSILLTMVDGKVCNAAMDTASTMRCYI